MDGELQQRQCGLEQQEQQQLCASGAPVLPLRPGRFEEMSDIFTLQNIYKAYLDCRKRKKNTTSALKFELEREKNLISLLKDLKSKRYKISKHICFVVKDPVPREVFAAEFRDRVVHHLLCNELNNLFEFEFIDTSFANRVGKGTHKGVEKLREYLKGADENKYFLKLDIKSFFCSINKDILFGIMEQKIRAAQKSTGWKFEVLWLVRKIIYHDPSKNYIYKGDPVNHKLIPREKSLFYSKGKGLPIGNLTSQFFANIYLNELDRFVCSRGHKQYIRYVDDFVILGGREIINDLPKIRQFLEEKLDLKLSEKKTRFQQVYKGIDFLGYYIKPDYVLVRRKIVHRFKQKLHRYYNLEIKKFQAIANSYFGHFTHANSFRLRRAIFEKYFRKFFIPKEEYVSLTIKK